MEFGTGWAKSLSFVTGQCPVMKYHRGLMHAILNDRIHIAKDVNAQVIGLDEAPRGYAEFDKGAATDRKSGVEGRGEGRGGEARGCRTGEAATGRHGDGQ